MSNQTMRISASSSLKPCPNYVGIDDENIRSSTPTPAILYKVSDNQALNKQRPSSKCLKL